MSGAQDKGRLKIGDDLPGFFLTELNGTPFFIKEHLAEWLRARADECADLIYLDPPYGTGRGRAGRAGWIGPVACGAVDPRRLDRQCR